MGRGGAGRLSLVASCSPPRSRCSPSADAPRDRDDGRRRDRGRRREGDAVPGLRQPRRPPRRAVRREVRARPRGRGGPGGTARLRRSPAGTDPRVPRGTAQLQAGEPPPPARPGGDLHRCTADRALHVDARPAAAPDRRRRARHHGRPTPGTPRTSFSGHCTSTSSRNSSRPDTRPRRSGARRRPSPGRSWTASELASGPQRDETPGRHGPAAPRHDEPVVNRCNDRNDLSTHAAAQRRRRPRDTSLPCISPHRRRVGGHDRLEGRQEVVADRGEVVVRALEAASLAPPRARPKAELGRKWGQSSEMFDRRAPALAKPTPARSPAP